MSYTLYGHPRSGSCIVELALAEIDVLPEAHRRDDVVTNIVKEMRWAHGQLGTP